MEKKEVVLADASDMFSNLLADYKIQYTNISDENEIKKHSRNNFRDFSLHTVVIIGLIIQMIKC